MLSDVLGVIDHLISVTKYRNERFRSKYRELWDPVFHDLLLVHTDYVKMFEQVHFRIRKSCDQELFFRAIELLREKRVEFEAIREKLRAIVGTLSSKSSEQPAEVDDFIQEVSSYFQGGPLWVNSTPSTELMARLTKVGEDSDREFSSEEMRSMRYIVENALSEIRQHWSRVCEAYAELTVSAAEKA